MSRLASSGWTAVMVAGAVISAGAIQTGDRPVAAIVAELDSLKTPAPDQKRMSTDPAYRKEHFSKLREANQKRAKLTLEDETREEGGLDKLKKFVEEQEIAWPQYYQGKGWNSEFSTSWGIDAIPAVFIIDTEGKLFSVKPRGKLEEMIPMLLETKKSLN